MSLTRKAFSGLVMSMMGFGQSIGIMFPYFVVLLLGAIRYHPEPIQDTK